MAGCVKPVKQSPRRSLAMSFYQVENGIDRRSWRDAMLCGVTAKKVKRSVQADGTLQRRHLATSTAVPRTPVKRPLPEVESSKENEVVKHVRLMALETNFDDDLQTLVPSIGRVGTRGQLKLAVYVNNGLLTVHIMQARQLRAKNSTTCAPYVEVSLFPGDDLHPLCRTESLQSTESPNFDEKFSFEVMEEDQKKRLMVSMRSTNTKNCNDLLGCMSFGVKHLLSRKKNVNGWYYLLSENVGKRKHLQASRRQVFKDKVSKSGSIPEVNKSLQGLETLTIVVKRGRQGYGFTVMGYSPVSVGKVEDGSHAEVAGLHKSDAIVRINGQNVSRSSADSVAKIVKNSQKQIVLDVVRTQRHHTTSSSIKTDSLCGSATSSQVGGSTGMSDYYDFLPPQPCPSSASEKSFSVPRTPASKRSNKENSLPSKQRKITDDTSSIFWTPKQPQQNQNITEQVSWQQSKLKTDSCVMSPWQPEYDTYDELPWEPNSEIYDELPWKPFDCDLDTAQLEDEPSYQSMDLTEYDDADMSTMTCPPVDETDCTANYAHTTLPELTISFQDLTCQEQARQAAIKHLIDSESQFIHQMQRGIQRYSRPLRHCILTPQEHRTLFQNVEKLVAISEYHMRQLAGNSLAYADLQDDTERYVNTVGPVYQPKVALLCEAYEQYCGGLDAALRALHDLQLYEEFYEFISHPPPEGAEPTIDEFLKRPAEHLKTVMLTLRTVMSHTTPEHHDSAELKNIVEALSTSCNKLEGNTSSKRRTNSTGSNSSRSHSSGSFGSGSSGSRSLASVNSTGSAASVDSELLDIQSRLLFPAHVTTFQLATPGRHVIYTGELLKVEGCKWTRVYALLLSDMLLLTRLERDNLVVLDSPLALPDIMNYDFGCSHPCEFTLEAECQSTDSTGRLPRCMLLRAPSMEQKCTWKSLLEQRISSFRSHRELMTCRARDLMM